VRARIVFTPVETARTRPAASVRARFAFPGLIVGCLALSLALGCAAQYEEPAGTQPDAAREQASPAEVAMEPAAAADEAPERTLDDIQIELASNEAKLLALGVVVPGRAVAGGDADLGGEAREREGKPDATVNGGTTATSETRPSTVPAPKPQPSAPGKAAGSSSSIEQGRRDKPEKKKKSGDLAVDDRFAQPPAEQAKATPLSPNEQPKLDAATRCTQVCELSEITCELGVQICGLAQRHAGDDDYEQACARATDDCDAAQEACDVCAG
jgi:hypothetical protein